MQELGLEWKRDYIFPEGNVPIASLTARSLH